MQHKLPSTTPANNTFIQGFTIFMISPDLTRGCWGLGVPNSKMNTNPAILIKMGGDNRLLAIQY